MIYPGFSSAPKNDRERSVTVVADSSTTRAQKTWRRSDARLFGTGASESPRVGTRAGRWRRRRGTTLSRFEYQFVILQVNDHNFELVEKINSQQAVYFLAKAL